MEVINSKALKDVMMTQCVGIVELARKAHLQPYIVTKFPKANCKARFSTVGRIAKALQIEPQTLLAE